MRISIALVVLSLPACAPSGADRDPAGRSPAADTPVLPTAPVADTAALPALRLVEVMADNDSTWGPADDDGRRPDWVELVNASAQAIDWSRIAVSDAGSGTWTGTADRGTLGAGARALLDSDTLGFRLDGDGDGVTVFVDGRRTDELTWDEAAPDTSLARIPDPDGAWTATAWPTPDAPNGAAPSPTLDAADATVFVSDRVHTIDLVVDADAYDALAQGDSFIGTFNDYQEVAAELTIDGVHFPAVGLRRKGSASTDPLSGKPPFKVDLNELVPGTRFRTLEAFNLHNGKVMDPTLIHEHLSYRLARAVGLAAPRVGWAVVTLNGLDYGIYALVETHDDVFVEHHFPGAGEQGVVLEPNESSDGGWLSASDFGSGQLDWDFEEGQVPVDPAMIAAVERVDDLVRGPATDEAVAELWTVAEREAVLTYLAWENVVGHTDGYHVPNNWRLFVDPATKRLQLLPSGADWTWDDPADPWFWGGALASWCLDNAGCTSGVAERMVTVADTVQTIDLLGDYERIWSGIEPLGLSQPRPNHSDRVIRAAHQRTLEALVELPADARADACDEVPSTCP